MLKIWVCFRNDKVMNLCYCKSYFGRLQYNLLVVLYNHLLLPINYFLRKNEN